jgi:Fe2+ transport system protein FeoA
MTASLWLPLSITAALILGIGLTFLYTRQGNDRTASNDPLESPPDLLAAGLLPLADCPLDCQACLKCMQVDHCIVLRLRELGLTPGVQVRVVQDTGGPMLVSVRGSRVALGRDLTRNMWVELSAPDREQPAI